MNTARINHDAHADAELWRIGQRNEGGQAVWYPISRLPRCNGIRHASLSSLDGMLSTMFFNRYTPFYQNPPSDNQYCETILMGTGRELLDVAARATTAA